MFIINVPQGSRCFVTLVTCIKPPPVFGSIETLINLNAMLISMRQFICGFVSIALYKNS